MQTGPESDPRFSAALSAALSAERAGLVQLLLSLTRRPELAEEAVQDAYVRALGSRGPRSASAGPAWLLQIARRALFNRIRGEQRREDHDFRAGEDRLQERSYASPTADTAARTELHERFRAEVEALPEPHRSALEDRYFAGLTGAQVAARDGESIETVKSRVVRARAALLRRLEREGLFGDVHWTIAAAPLLGAPGAVSLGEISAGTKSGSVGLPAASTGSLGWWVAAPAAVGALGTLAVLATLLLALRSGSKTPQSTAESAVAAETSRLAEADEGLVWVEEQPSTSVSPGRVPIATTASDSAVGSPATEPASSEQSATVKPSGREQPLAASTRQILGRVTTQGGSPIEGAAVRGFPRSGGTGLMATSDANGEFAADLAVDEVYTLEVTHEDYAQWGATDDRTRLFDGAASPIDVVLEELPRVTFRIVDARTGQGLTPDRFQIVAARPSSNRAPRWPARLRSLDSAESTGFECGARAELDWIAVEVRGYLRAFVQVDAGPGGQQTIRMERGGEVVGRVLRGDIPVTGAAVQLDRGFTMDGVFLARSESVVTCKTSEDGTFQLTGLEVHQRYRMSVRGRDGWGLQRNEVQITPARLDLGDLVLQPGGAVRGTLTGPPGLDLSGLEVRLGERGHRRVITADADGAFSADGLMPGRYPLLVGGRDGVVEDGARLNVDIAAGEMTEVSLDLTDWVLVDVSIEIAMGSLPASGVEVQLVPTGLVEGDPTELMRLMGHMGRTDANGIVRGKVRAMGDACVRIHSASIGFLRADGSPLNLSSAAAGEPPAHHVARFAVGELEFRLPESAELPQEGLLVIYVEPLDEPEGSARSASRQYITIPVMNGQPTIADDPFLRWSAGRWSLLGVAVGRKRVSIHATARGAKDVKTLLPGGGMRMGPERAFELEAEAEIEAGLRTTLRL